MNKRNRAIITAAEKGYIATKKGDVIGPRGEILKDQYDRDGYRYFNIKECGVYSHVRIHRFIAFMLFGERVFEKGVQVRHLDGNKTNCTPENLALGSQSENMMDKPEAVRLMQAKKKPPLLYEK